MHYTIQFKFEAAKLNKNGSIKGASGGGECDIVTECTLDELATMHDDLKSIAYQAIIENPKIKKSGVSIINIDITNIFEMAQIESLANESK